MWLVPVIMCVHFSGVAGFFPRITQEAALTTSLRVNPFAAANVNELLTGSSGIFTVTPEEASEQHFDDTQIKEVEAKAKAKAKAKELQAGFLHSVKDQPVVKGTEPLHSYVINIEIFQVAKSEEDNRALATNVVSTAASSSLSLAEDLAGTLQTQIPQSLVRLGVAATVMTEKLMKNALEAKVSILGIVENQYPENVIDMLLQSWLSAVMKNILDNVCSTSPDVKFKYVVAGLED